MYNTAKGTLYHGSVTSRFYCISKPFLIQCQFKAYMHMHGRNQHHHHLYLEIIQFIYYTVKIELINNKLTNSNTHTRTYKYKHTHSWLCMYNVYIHTLTSKQKILLSLLHNINFTCTSAAILRANFTELVKSFEKEDVQICE